MIYKAIPGPMVVEIKNNDLQSATNLFADIINAQAADGWRYYSMETITTQEKVGCALQQQVVSKNIYMLIFCKEQ